MRTRGQTQRQRKKYDGLFVNNAINTSRRGRRRRGISTEKSYATSKVCERLTTGQGYHTENSFAGTVIRKNSGIPKADSLNLEEGATRQRKIGRRGTKCMTMAKN